MYSKIHNPKTNKFVGINTKVGQAILNNYLNMLNGGGTDYYHYGGMTQLKNAAASTRSAISSGATQVRKAAPAFGVKKDSKANTTVSNDNEVVQEVQEDIQMPSPRPHGSRADRRRAAMPSASVSNCPLIYKEYEKCQNDPTFLESINNYKKQVEATLKRDAAIEKAKLEYDDVMNKTQ
jgi:hypothetical protein